LTSAGVRLHLVDGTYELFRAWFSKRPDHVDAKGRDVKATVGVVSSMFALLADPQERATHVAAAFDNPVRSFRNDLFDAYKTDEGVPSELLEQFDLVEDAARSLGMVVWSMDRYEADDAMATAAARWSGRVAQVRLLTPDKDLGQAIRGERVVMVDRIRGLVIDEAALWQKRGIRPDSVPDWLALVGDSADGIPGLAGFGDKTAATLLRAFGHLEGIPLDPKRWPTPIRQADRLVAILREQMPQALLYRKLATLMDDVPLPERFEDLAWTGVPRGPFEAWCVRVAAPDLRDRPTRFRMGDG